MQLNIIFTLSLLLVSVLSMAQVQNIQVGSSTRSMVVYTPANLGQNRPLLISLHGLNQDPTYQRNQAQWEKVADTAKFVVIYPEAQNKSWDISGNKDIDFMVAIINDMKTRHNIDLNRVYISGFSMGGMMSYHVANKMVDKVAAIAPVSGYLFANPVSSSRPMPIIHTHGTTDDVVVYSGLAAIIEKWRSWNGCPSQGVTTKPYPANIPSSKSSKTYWAPCKPGTEMVLLTLDNKGHWHSNDDAGVHTTKEIWNFIRKFSLNPGPTISFTSPLDKAVFSANTPIVLSVSASVPNGSITNVKFYDGTTLLNTDNSAPYSFSWNNASIGSHTIKAVMTDNQGKTVETSITIKVNEPQGPYNGTWHTIPGTIQFEHFDVGGNGISYNDASAGNTGGSTFRTDEDVDIENCTDAGAGYNIGFATAGEWLEYSVDVKIPGTYDLDLRVAAEGAGRTVSVSMDGVNIANNVVIPNTGGWQIWQTIKVKDINLTTGKKVMRLTIGATDYVNLNYGTFVLTKELKKEAYNGVASSIPGRIEAEHYDLGGEGLAYHEANANGNEGGATLRNDEVDIETTQDVGGGYNIAYILKGEWLEYTVNVSSDGTYDLDLRVAVDGDGRTLQIQMDGKDVTGSVDIPNTGAWQQWQTVTVKGINLTAGEHVMRIVFESDYMNLNYVEFRSLVTSLSESSLEGFRVFPNPFSNQVSIEYQGDFTFQITTLSGRIIEEGIGKDKLELNYGDFEKGVYILTIKQNGHIKTTRLIKE